MVVTVRDVVVIIIDVIVDMILLVIIIIVMLASPRFGAAGVRRYSGGWGNRARRLM